MYRGLIQSLCGVGLLMIGVAITNLRLMCPVRSQWQIVPRESAMMSVSSLPLLEYVLRVTGGSREEAIATRSFNTDVADSQLLSHAVQAALLSDCAELPPFTLRASRPVFGSRLAEPLAAFPRLQAQTGFCLSAVGNSGKMGHV